MYDDFSGGSLDTVTLDNIEFLGTIALESRFVTEIKVVAGTRPHEVTTHDGSVYRGRAPRLWLATPTLRINLTKTTSLTLRRAPTEASPSG